MGNLNKEMWVENRVREDQIKKYLRPDGSDFINDKQIETELNNGSNPDNKYIRDIISKSLAIETLTPEETAALLNVEDPEMWKEMEVAAGQIKRKVYDNRIVTFAPLYLSTACVNNCLYCGLRTDNNAVRRGVLSVEEVKREIEVLAGTIGHKRLIIVYGEHPESDVDYMANTMEAIYNVKASVKGGETSIRRVNVNAAPLSTEDLKRLNQIGIGTYQVFQETYHHNTYNVVHPPSTIKGNFRWRLYCMHRALEAGIDDVGIGALFGLYDWKFEVMGLLHHAIELEEKFGIGPHTISFPRLEPAENTPFTLNSKYQVSDEDFRKIVTVLRLAVPYTGMILTARENSKMRRSLIPYGITQTDASSKIGLGAYNSYEGSNQQADRQQFILGDTRSLDEVVRELAQMGHITSFCTAGYRCGRTGQCIMDLLRTGAEGKFCKLNAVITYREWLDDFASDTTKEIGEKIITKEIEEIREKMPAIFDDFMNYYTKTAEGQRDLYF
ncbi:[FeFe] hydrogenase H-cluster radical SAM maturase HydG [Chitinispirillales bacterium ANBcel5]|uniref:[FeFe] hydrogenase H-cluster radical SAM maturase HydG n=1 Tax=Cellulosispirillum alkaliphilum TaxID=3039283 RepID=UPI002A516600|nr:[FeFe] hydrogenase H-cluster radical SAM maturase HydG [Chitinispirillales bacterium ANBcel5]